MSKEENKIDWLRSLDAVRTTCSRVYDLAAQKDGLQHLSLDLSQLDQLVEFVHGIIQRDYPSGVSDIPFHSRWRHFDVGGTNRVNILLVKWKALEVPPIEIVRRLLDLAVISVLLDAGAGPKWQYREAMSGKTFSRSEGLAVVSFYMFNGGLFSSNVLNQHQVDAGGLKLLTQQQLLDSFQVKEPENPLVGAVDRYNLLRRLSDALQQNEEFFLLPGSDKTQLQNYRPGCMVDYFLKGMDESRVLDVGTIWNVVSNGLSSIWPPTRTKLDGVSLGDVWPCESLPASEEEKLVCFHKLSQWLTYSLMEPLKEYLDIKIAGLDKMTGLAEYRNGGLFLDFEVIKFKNGVPTESLDVHNQIIVEWRALTVILLDLVAEKLRAKYGLTKEQLPLVCVLQGGTWQAGREIAWQKRPQDGGPMISIQSDGTVF